jgi:hypothetical protein
MAWLEKRDPRTTQVCVVELRTRTIWERVAKGKSPGRGRVRLAGEYATEQEASEAFRARLAQLQSEGYVVLDAAAGVDALGPSSSGSPARATPIKATPAKATIVQVLEVLRRNLDNLPTEPRLALVLDALDRTMRSVKRGFRSKGFTCDLTVRGSARWVAKVASQEDYWREIGCAAEFSVPDEHETEDECIDSETSSWPGFVAMVREDAAWRAVAELPCTLVEIVDDEID